jgi:hypothetical protein
VHDTPDRELNVAPLGTGVDWTDQLVPFHASASVAWIPFLVPKFPTAMQAVPEVHETPSRSL